MHRRLLSEDAFEGSRRVGCDAKERRDRDQIESTQSAESSVTPLLQRLPPSEDVDIDMHIDESSNHDVCGGGSGISQEKSNDNNHNNISQVSENRN